MVACNVLYYCDVQHNEVVCLNYIPYNLGELYPLLDDCNGHFGKIYSHSKQFFK